MCILNKNSHIELKNIGSIFDVSEYIMLFLITLARVLFINVIQKLFSALKEIFQQKITKYVHKMVIAFIV